MCLTKFVITFMYTVGIPRMNGQMPKSRYNKLANQDQNNNDNMKKKREKIPSPGNACSLRHPCLSINLYVNRQSNKQLNPNNAIVA